MALSPKDDPRTWLLPGPRPVPRPPLHARLLYYELTTAERALLRAMFEHAPEGAMIEASPETLAGPSGVSVRNQWNLIHGRNRKDGSRIPGFLERRILDCTRKGRRAPHPKPAAYRFNEWACRLRPEVLAYLKAGIQQTLPGIPRPKEPSKTAPASAMVADEHRQWLPTASAMVADDSKATTSKTERDSTTATPLSLADQEGGIDVDVFVASLIRRR
jgi:hypothetical protein